MPVAVDLTYVEVSPILNKVSMNHCRMYGGDYENIRANANTHFLSAYHEYDYRGTFEPYLVWFVRNRLINEFKSELSLKARDQSYVREESYESSGFILSDFLEGLNPDAARLVRVAFQLQGGDQQQGGRAKPPVNKGGSRTKVHVNKGGIRAKPLVNRGRPKTALSAIKEYMRDVGWSLTRITAAVQEIREALS